jgi:hypothetical protein
MMADKSLVMSFMNEEGKKVSLRLDGIKEDITGDAVGLVMDTIITKNIFQTTGGDLKVKDSAQIVTRDVHALEVR